MTSDPAYLYQIQLPAHFGNENLTFDDWHDSALLDSGGSLEAVGVDSWRQVSLICTLLQISISSIPRRSSLFRFMASKESVTSS